MNDTARTSLYQTLEAATGPWPDAIRDEFMQAWDIIEVHRKVVLTPIGGYERYLYFVLEGVQRVYAVDDEGRESTLAFMYPYSFAGVADAFLLKKKARYAFETITPSKFLRMSHTRLEVLLQRYPIVQETMLHLTAMALEGVLSRQIELQSLTSEQKFRVLMARSPHLLTLVPHKYIASYLGMDATNFSKFMNAIKIG